jgi:hypothetical protein
MLSASINFNLSRMAFVLVVLMAIEFGDCNPAAPGLRNIARALLRPYSLVGFGGMRQIAAPSGRRIRTGCIGLLRIVGTPISA